MPSTSRRAADRCSSIRRIASSAIWARPSPSSWRAGCARRRAPSRRRSPAPSARSTGIRQVAAAPNGYLNFFLERPRLPARPASTPAPRRRGRALGKAIVEHTAINPNKAAHIGHLRNSALGDTLVRVLRFRGIPVEVQNYIDDTGVQVADVVVGFRVLEGKTLDEIRAIADTTRFDYYCWDLYARVTEWYEQDKERLTIRAADAARHRARRQRERRDRRLHRRPDRPHAI